MTRGRRRADWLALLERGTTEHYEDPALYDFEYKDQESDIRFYRDLAEERAGELPVLELGAGTGRISIPMAVDGHHVVALDVHAGMLGHLRNKLAELPVELEGSVRPMEADMREIPLDDGSCHLVIAPFNALMHLYEWQDLLACFREVHRVLGEGGCFAFDVLLPDLDWLMWDPDKRHSRTKFKHPRDGRKMIYTTNHTYDHASQVCDIRIFYEPSHPSARVRAKNTETVHLAHRQIFPQEVRVLLAWAGFDIEEHSGDFLGLSLSADVESQIVVARRP